MTQTITLHPSEYTATVRPRVARECDSPGSAILLAALACAVLFWAPLIYVLTVML
jgi:hypothetical protein